MESNFMFLSKYWQDISELGQMAEKCLFSDPNTSILKSGILAEKIVKNIFYYERIDIPQDDSQSNLVRMLNKEYGLLPTNINNILYTIRKTRNDAAHQYVNDIEKAKGVLELSFELSCWFMETYGDWEFERPTYLEPTESEEENIDIKEYIKQQEERISKLEETLSLINTEAANKTKEEREERSNAVAENIISNLAEDSPALSITKEIEKLRIEVNANSLISLCLEQNSYKVIKSITIHKGDEDAKYKNLVLEITSNPSLTCEYKKEIEILEKSELFFNNIDIKLDVNKIATLTETTNAYLEAKLINKDTEEILVNEIIDVKFLPINFWQGTGILTDTISSFVTPNHPEINKIIADAAEKMRQLTGSSALSAYQSNDPNIVLNQAAAIYYAIKDLQIVYVEAPQSYEKFGQRIRLVNEIIKYKQGNCIDLSLLYASCLESVGLHPIVILENSHAYVGLWLTNSNFPDTVSDDKAQVIKRFSEGANEITILESTMMVADSVADFNEAQNQAKTRILDNEIYVEYIIDIKCCRLSGIRPLPLLIENNGQWEIKHEAVYENETINPDTVKTIDVDLEGKPITKKEQWEKKLLDLGLRNPLINMHLSRSIVPVLSNGGSKEVVDALLTGKNFDLRACPVTWPRDPSKDVFESFGNSKDTLPLTEILARSVAEKKFYTPFDEVTLIKKLTQLYRNSKQSLEENGASTLYLAAGLMKWCEVGNNKEHYAPLALIPIDLIKRPGNQGYFLSFRQDDTQINITLLEKLRHDFSISLSGLEEVPEDENGPDIAKIFVVFNKAVMSKPNWTILNSCYIGNFSFSQFVMWNDIHNRSEDLEKNKIVKSLIDGKLNWDAKPMYFEGQIDPEDTRLSVPVDSSQLFAIKEANKGASFVLHGPPGTGKSQTITALIGNALAHGKTVLFVAEKRAALEVVEKRLNDIGIGPFCLELHSNKAKKNEVLSQIETVLELKRKTNSISFDKQLENLNKCKSELNQYVKELHEQRKCGYSIFELINNYEENRNYPELPSKINVDFSKLTKDQITYLEGLVDDLVINARVVGTPSENKLRYVGRATYSIGLKEDVLVLSEEYKDALSRMEDVRTSLEMILPDNEYAKEDDYKELYNACENLKSIIDIPHKLLSIEDSNTIYSNIIKMCENFILSKDLLNKILEKWNSSILNTDFSEIFDRYEEANAQLHINEKLYLNDYNEINKYFDDINSLSAHAIKKDELKKQITSSWKEGVFNLDTNELLKEYTNAEGQWFLAKSININKVVKKLKDFSINEINKDSLKPQLELLAEHQIEKEEYDLLLEKYKDDLGILYSEISTDWQDICARATKCKILAINLQKEISSLTDTFVDINAIKKISNRVDEYKKSLLQADYSFNQYSYLLDLSNKEDTDWASLKEYFATIKNRVSNFDEFGENYIQLRTSFGGDRSIETLLNTYIGTYEKFINTKQEYYKLLELRDHPSNDWFEKENEICDGIYEKAGAIKEWLQWNDTCEKVSEENLGPAVEAYYKGFTNSQVAGGFRKTLYKELITNITNSNTVLNQFSGMLFDEKIRKYERLDAEFIDASKKEIYYTLLANLPDKTYEAAQSSELGILQKAIKNNGRGQSIRKLFERIPSLLIRLCPCMLMSPISVAQYLDPKRAPFDLVVFDEASQLQTCKAVGAIARGENAIIVGDPKQMPPTSFFMTQNTRDEDDIDFELEDMESILDDCLALTMPETKLLWHYRSRHESLIAFSNNQFYENKLYTFPSVNDKESKVSFVKVNGTFVRKDGNRRINVVEAARIVSEIKNRYKDPEHTKQSIGVVTFNIAQSNLIQDMLQDEFAKDVKFEEWANREYEPLFVKNLENVQGDERDVILFSITYGPDENGKVSMNFGPLNRDKGWRRLNVAVSRAKEEMVVFSSMSSERINTEKTRAKGVLALKSFLDYAEKGILSNPEIAQSIENEESANIAKAIAASLKTRGFNCDINVGKSGYKVDVAVIDPDNDENYILGILLDGAVYRDSNTIRDREIGQKSILSGLGWKVIRVWSMDWLDDRNAVINNIIKKIVSVIRGEEAEQQPVIVEQDNDEETYDNGQELDTKIKDLSYQYCPYTLVSSRMAYEPADFPRMPKRILLPILEDVIRKEKIITLPLLSQRAARYFGCSKATFNVTNAVSAVAPKPKKLCGENVYCSNELAITQKEYKLFRIVNEETKIDFRYIPVIEVVNAICFVLLKNYAMDKDSLIKETAKIMGYDRVGGLIEEKVSQIIDLAFDEKILEDTGTNSIMLNKEYRTELISNNTEIVFS